MITVADDGRVRVVTFDRPERLNAFDTPLYRAAGTALREASADPNVACVVLTGSGRAFSAGQDLGEMGAIDTSSPEAAAHGFPTFMDALTEFDKPLVAAVNGIAVGIGLTMLLYCDLVLVSTSARLRAPFAPLGVAPEAASSLLLPQAMGRQPAALALFTGEWIQAGDAVASGLALAQHEPDELLPAARSLAQRIAAMPIVSLTATKRLLNASRREAVAAARAREDEAFSQLVLGPANLEAITAFLEKRAPDFSAL